MSVAPGPVLAPSGGFEHSIRLSFALPWDDRVARAVQRLGRIARGLADRAAP